MTAERTRLNIETHLILQGSKEGQIQLLNPESSVAVSDIEGAEFFLLLPFDEQKKLLPSLTVFTIRIVNNVQYLFVIVHYHPFFSLHKSD